MASPIWKKPAPALLRTAAIPAIGGALAIGLMALAARLSGHPVLSYPFTTSIVLVMAAPQSRPARPRNVVVGHLASAAAGLVTVALLGPSDLSAAIGVGLAIALMVAADALHPPAGINALMPSYLPLDWQFLVMPVGLGALALVLFAKAYHRLAGTGSNDGGLT